MEGRNAFRHKWVIPIAALILVLSIGAGAWAATDPGEGTRDGTQPLVSTAQATSDSTAQARSNTTPADQMIGLAEERPYCAPGEKPGFGGRGGMRGGMGDSEEWREAREKARAERQQRFEAFVDSIREQMTPEDQAKLDQLLQQREAQREAVQKAAEELRQTTQELRDLIKQYRPSSESGRPSNESGGRSVG